MYNKAGNKGKVIVGSHEEKILKLSNNIWGQKIELGKGSTVKDAEEEVITGQTCFNELFRYHTKIASRVGHGGEEILMQALDLVGEKMLEEWDQQWKDVQIQQMSLNVTTSKLFHDQTQILLEALKAASGNA